MTPIQIRVLVTVAEHGSFSRAAVALNQTQPYVSRTVAGMEQLLGAQIFIREKKRLEITSFGHEALKRARAILREFDGLRSLASDKRSYLRGTLKVGTEGGLANWPLLRILSQLRRKHPELETRTFEGSTADLAAWAAEGIVDALLATCAYSGWRWLPLAQETFVVAGQWHPNAPMKLEEIASAGALVTNHDAQSVIETHFSDLNLSLPIVQRSQSYCTILAMAEEGLGVAMVPRSLAALTRARVTIREIENGPVRTIGALLPASATFEAEAFVEEAQHVMAAD